MVRIVTAAPTKGSDACAAVWWQVAQCMLVTVAATVACKLPSGAKPLKGRMYGVGLAACCLYAWA
jgi:hypothetical protein